MSVIDLDSAPQAAPQPPTTGKGRLAAVVLLCGLLFLGAAEAKVVPWALDVAQVGILEGSLIHVSGPDLLISGSGRVIAYDLASGRERWRTETGLVGGDLWHIGDLVIVLGADPRALDGGTYLPRTVGIDQATGAVRWRADGNVVLEGGLLLLYGDSAVSLLREDGSKVWTLDGRGITPAIGERATIVATLDKRTGELIERVLPSLAELRRAILPDAQGADGMWFYDGTLNIFHSERDVQRYDTATLTRLLGPPPEEFRVDCGRVWCMINENRLVDKATGAVVYQTKGWEYAVVNDAGVLGLGLLIGDGEPTLVREIFDPRSGTATNLKGWVALNLNPGAPVQAPGRAILLAYRGEKSSHLALFDDTGLHQLGPLPLRDIAYCALSGELLACRVGAELVRIWRLT
jgi:PQQ-like domain